MLSPQWTPQLPFLNCVTRLGSQPRSQQVTKGSVYYVTPVRLTSIKSC